jgi:hypothetical protein
MTIEQAKKYYRQMGCSHFHMGRESSERYKEYLQLNIPAELEVEWEKEQFDEYYGAIKRRTESDIPLWTIHSCMYDLFENQKNDDQLSKLLEATYLIREVIPLLNKVMVAETINGRTIHQARRGLIFQSYDMGRLNIAREFIELSLYFSKCKGMKINEISLEKFYNHMPIPLSDCKNYKSFHLERCEQARKDCIEIRSELGL